MNTKGDDDEMALLQRRKLELEVRDLERAPIRTLLITILTTVATAITALTVALLGFLINAASNGQKDVEEYRDLVKALDDRSAATRAAGAIGLSRYMTPPQGLAQLIVPQIDRSQQTFTLLFERIPDEDNQSVQGAIVSALSNATPQGNDIQEAAHVGYLTHAQLNRALLDANYSSLFEATAGGYANIPGYTLSGTQLYITAITLEEGLRKLPVSRSTAEKGEPNLATRVLQSNAAAIALANLLNKHPDLQYVRLYDVRLLGLNADGKSAYGIDLRNAIVQGSARGVDFSCGNLAYADLRGLDVTGARFYGTTMDRAYLQYNATTPPDLRGSNFTGASQTASANALYRKARSHCPKDSATHEPAI